MLVRRYAPLHCKTLKTNIGELFAASENGHAPYRARRVPETGVGRSPEFNRVVKGESYRYSLRVESKTSASVTPRQGAVKMASAEALPN